MIRIEGLTKDYGATRVLAGVDLELEAGEVLLLLGTNGAGKSTLFRCLLGLVDYEGSVRVDGLDPLEEGRAVRQRIGYMPQSAGLHGDLTVVETLDFYSDLRTVPRDEGHRLLQEVGLEEASDVRVDELSGGMRQRLAFAVALLGDPPVLLLDEPTASLDGWSRELLVERVRELAVRGKAVLLATHAEKLPLEDVGRQHTLRDGRLLADAGGVA
jgi:heme ABC exporter ATP-binding subunit CcmA